MYCMHICQTHKCCELIYRNRDGDVIKFNVDTDEKTILVHKKKFEMYKASKYEVSPDLKHVLLAYNVAPVYQHSYTAFYIICSLDTPATWNLNPPEVRNAQLQFAGWGPQDQQLFHAIVFTSPKMIHCRPNILAKDKCGSQPSLAEFYLPSENGARSFLCAVD
ncbi:hypothetical protein NQZ68_039694 [Dissostichus eleginoides]|nr:hypothetical protein NQZ68_039694 [Dissostichus eleginoides]